MSPALTTFLFEAANFLILAVLLGWFFFKPVRRALEERRRALAAETEQSGVKLAEAERLRGEIAREREALAAELEQQRARVMARNEEEARSIVAAAREQAQREREAAQQALASLSRAERERMARGAAAAAREVVVRLLAQLGAPALDDCLVRAAHAGFAQANGSLGPITVESAQLLDADQQLSFSSLFGSDARPVFRVVPDLIAGVRIITGRGMVDASVSGLAAYAERALTAAEEAARE